MEVIRKDPGRPVLKQNRENGIEYLTFPGLEACGAAQHMFSTRIGGVSEGIYASMNLSFTRGTTLWRSGKILPGRPACFIRIWALSSVRIRPTRPMYGQ